MALKKYKQIILFIYVPALFLGCPRVNRTYLVQIKDYNDLDTVYMDDATKVCIDSGCTNFINLSPVFIQKERNILLNIIIKYYKSDTYKAVDIFTSKIKVVSDNFNYTLLSSTTNEDLNDYLDKYSIENKSWNQDEKIPNNLFISLQFRATSKMNFIDKKNLIDSVKKEIIKISGVEVSIDDRRVKLPILKYSF